MRAGEPADLSAILRAATAAIGPDYFHLPIDGGVPVYRERVYCYELYHQMRSRWPPGFGFTLNGEVDKRAHPILRRMAPRMSIPDFLVHTPGAMAGNDTIIEVKHARTAAPGFRKDLQTLNRFVTSFGYQRAIYLIYGTEAEDTVAMIRGSYLAVGADVPVELWLHTAAAQPATHRQTLTI